MVCRRIKTLTEDVFGIAREWENVEFNDMI